MCKLSMKTDSTISSQILCELLRSYEPSGDSASWTGMEFLTEQDEVYHDPRKKGPPYLK